jgi:DNA-binding NarL/FixJ family response regulator
VATIPSEDEVRNLIQVLIVDDHAMVRKGLRALLNEYEDIRVIGEASNGFKAVELTKQLDPDVILMDLAMPLMDGVETIKQIRANNPEQRLIVLTSYVGDEKLIQSIRAGAMGYLLKDAQPEDLVGAIRLVYAGEPALNPGVAWKYLRKASGIEETPKYSSEELSDREMEVLRLLSQGKTDQEIARQLVLTDVTIRTHVSRILAKLGLENRVQAVLYAIRSGLVPLDDGESDSVGD